MQSARESISYRELLRFPGYRVGSDGSLWSNRPINGRGDSGPWRRKEINPDKTGYLRVSLMRNGKLHLVGVHRLVLEAFVGPGEVDQQACHNNGDRADNRLCNLRWDTPKGNQADRLLHGTDARGERNGRAKLTREDAETIRAEYATRRSTQVALANRYGVTPTMIRLIVKGKNWKSQEPTCDE